MPANTYYAKKLISPLTMGVEKIDACRNHCILYRGDDYKDLESCPNCGASRYITNKEYREEENVACVKTGKKRKKTQKNTKESSKTNSNEEVDYYTQRRIPALVMSYLPVVDQLRGLFVNPEDAKLIAVMLLMRTNTLKNFDIHPMPSSGKISMTHTRILLTNQGT